MSEFLRACEQAARAGARVLCDLHGKINVREKAPRDLVTEADVASQEAIREIVLGEFPDHEFLGEESNSSENPGRAAGDGLDRPAEYRWIVDPLDGTTNYVHQLPSFAVSVALEQAGKVIVGTVIDPVLNECFTAAAGEGAFLNGKRLQTSYCQKLEQALVAASLSAKVDRDSPEVARLIEVVYCCQALRRMGSAALNLCYLAGGRLDAYFATSVKIWDVAAGMLILEEAGGVVTDVDGSPFKLQRPTFAASATPELQAELLQVLRRAVA